ncbi:hypothetical protein [Nocardia nova]|uniref:hypothetical protein n=1 Tax=Nocardia nova TaxID=37330 RepID=UPI00340DB1EE
MTICRIDTGCVGPRWAELLREIQQLADASARLLPVMHRFGPDSPSRAETAARIIALDRARTASEARARDNGVPAEWITRARVLGTRRVAWNPDRPFPAPATTPPHRGIPSVCCAFAVPPTKRRGQR